MKSKSCYATFTVNLCGVSVRSKCVGCLLILIGIAVIGPRTETQWETRGSAQTQSGSARSAVESKNGSDADRVHPAGESNRAAVSNRTLAACRTYAEFASRSTIGGVSNIDRGDRL